MVGSIKKMSPLSAQDDNFVAGVCGLLRMTLSGQQNAERKDAERQLEQFSSQPDFVPILLRIIRGSAGDRNAGAIGNTAAVQQSAAVYLKNCVMKKWPSSWENEAFEASLDTAATASHTKYFDVSTCLSICLRQPLCGSSWQLVWET
jgi:Importin-beta N-terminal domain